MSRGNRNTHVSQAPSSSQVRSLVYLCVALIWINHCQCFRDPSAVQAAEPRAWGNASYALIHYDLANHSCLGVGGDPTLDGKPTRLIAGEIPLGLTAGSKLDFHDHRESTG